MKRKSYTHVLQPKLKPVFTRRTTWRHVVFSCQLLSTWLKL